MITQQDEYAEILTLDKSVNMLTRRKPPNTMEPRYVNLNEYETGKLVENNLSSQDIAGQNKDAIPLLKQI